MSKNTPPTGITKVQEHDLSTGAAEHTAMPVIPGIRTARAMTEVERTKRGMKAEVTYPLEDGQAIEGMLLGRGGDAEVNARDGSKTKSKLPTFRIQVAPTVVVRILAGANLVGQLDALAVGTHVIVSRLGAPKGQQVVQYLVETGKTYEAWAGFERDTNIAPPNGAAS